MGVPSPAIPSFTDGQIVHSTDLNAIASNLLNLYNFNQGGFLTQKPAVVALQTTGQNINSGSDTLITFNNAPVNTNNMWVASQATQITVQTAGVYLVFGQVRYPTFTGATLSTVCTANLWLNGTTPAAAVGGADTPFVTTGSGPSPMAFAFGNYAAGSVFRLDAWHTAGSTITTATSSGGSVLAAFFLTPSS